jgi:phenylpyruvate tautomerase PptA (4-oxalocrotonate tautomerase family)
MSSPAFWVDLTVPEKVLSNRRRAQLLQEATAAVKDAAGLDDDDDEMWVWVWVWVLIHEIPEGRWGAYGTPVTVQRLRDLVADGHAEQAPA